MKTFIHFQIWLYYTKENLYQISIYFDVIHYRRKYENKYSKSIRFRNEIPQHIKGRIAFRKWPPHAYYPPPFIPLNLICYHIWVFAFVSSPRASLRFLLYKSLVRNFLKVSFFTQNFGHFATSIHFAGQTSAFPVAGPFFFRSKCKGWLFEERRTRDWKVWGRGGESQGLFSTGWQYSVVRFRRN